MQYAFAIMTKNKAMQSCERWCFMDLLQLRRKANLTQREIAVQVGITRQMISAIEHGASTSVGTAKKIAAVMGFDWHLFFEDKGVDDGMD